jgi:hypothetical protein
MKYVIAAGVIAVSCIFGNAAFAQMMPCMSRVLSTGAYVPAQQIQGTSNHWAHAQFTPPMGYPTIVYGPSFFQLPRIMQVFTSIHECGHLQGTTSEFLANCYALRNGHWSPEQIRFIANYHRAVGPLPPQYGGSGSAFWQQTLATCPEFSAY